MVIPCYKVAPFLTKVLANIGPEVSAIYCVIDGCGLGSDRAAMAAMANDARIIMVTHDINQGVGQAFITGCRLALEHGADIVVKLDGDGQMDPGDILRLVEPLQMGLADYSKGNRFFHLEDLHSMPIVRMVGNAVLSFFSKLSTGYWNIFDPTNGFIAIHSNIANRMPWEKLHQRYFFESDMLFRLYTLRAVVVDVPMKSRYGLEKSNLSILAAMFQFPIFHGLNFAKRIFYRYFLREFNIASLHLLLSLALIGFGTCFGVFNWVRGNELNQLASAGTVMFAALPIILGWQALLSFFAFDVGNVPRSPQRWRLRATVPGDTVFLQATKNESE